MENRKFLAFGVRMVAQNRIDVCKVDIDSIDQYLSPVISEGEAGKVALQVAR